MNYLETICIKDNVAQNMEYHIERMRKNSTAQLPDLSESKLDGRVKCRVVYNAFEIISVEYMPYKLPAIKSLKVVESSTVVYDVKYENRSVLSALYAERGGCDDVVICKNGNVGDSYFCNLVFCRDGQLFTPDTPLLCGVKRHSLIDSGVVTPCRITQSDILKYDGIYLINAMLDLADNIFIPINKIIL